MIDLPRARAETPGCENVIHLNNAGAGLMPAVVLQTLFNTGGWNLIDDLRQKKQIGDFLIVAPEGKRSFFVNSSDGKFRYSDFFLNEFMPYIEHKYRVQAERKSRAITGVSMGGYGALRFALHTSKLQPGTNGVPPLAPAGAPRTAGLEILAAG